MTDPPAPKTPLPDIHEPAGDNIYRLRLFVTGATLNSAHAISNIKQFCETYLKDSYELEIIDVYQQKLLAAKERITTLPMLIKTTPLPQRRLIGDMSDTQKVMQGLNLPAVE